MKKEELLRLCGSMEQLASARPVTYEDGQAEGMKTVLVRSGSLEFALMQSKCLDPAWINWKGLNLSYLTKPGLQGKTIHDTDEKEAPRSIMAGAMMTCGFENIHGCISIDEKMYPTHGRIRSTPAEKVCIDSFFRGDDYVVSVSGEMREAEIFGENMVLRRRVETTLGTPEIGFTDVIENQAFRDEPLCFLYHCNFGYPFLAPGTRVILPSIKCIPRDEAAEADAENWFVMGPPRDNVPEQVFLHHCAADADGNTFGAIVNDELKTAVCIQWNIREIPLLTQWKSEASGDYVMALEPCNTGFQQRKQPGKYLSPLSSHTNHLIFSFMEGDAAIAELEEKRKQLLHSGGYDHV